MPEEEATYGENYLLAYARGEICGSIVNENDPAGVQPGTKGLKTRGQLFCLRVSFEVLAVESQAFFR